ncbi:MAG: PAS domain S-box protein [Gemmatimonadota bacterium]|nr:PAS domain S-box protein [Gemmatimonadota bacterium]
MVDEIAPPAAPDASSDERYRPLFALSPQPAWVYDRETLRFLEVNEAAVRSYGWTREEFLAMTIRDIRPPSAQEQLDKLLRETRDSQRHDTISQHRTKSGRYLRVEINSYPLDFLGRSARMVLVHDITERESAAEALVLSEEKYRTVIEQLQDVFFRTDTAGHWTFLNQAWTTLTGNPVESSLGTHYLSYVHPSDRAAALDAVAPLTSGEAEAAIVEVRYFNVTGGYRWVEASTHVVRGDDGRVFGTMGTLRDVTERRAVNHERLRLETNIRQLLDASGEGIYGLDRDGVITFVNRRGSEMLGYQPDELIGQQMHDLTHYLRPDGSPYPASECPIHLTAVQGIPCQLSDEVMWRKDGRDMQVEYVASPVHEQGRLTGAVVNFRDITARKHAEFELIVARDAAESASRAKSDFLARMSHELRTPLNSIIGFANVLRKNRGGSMSEDQLSFSNRIATNGLHLLSLINDILDLSKIEAGRMTLDLSAVMLDTLVRETIDEFEGQTRDRPVVLRAEIPDVIRSIQMDAARMKQVLINLIGNALKFTERGEIVVTIDAEADGLPLSVIVHDTGIGIPQDRLDAIFNVFEQAESMTSRRFGGTGLGLAISRSLCELMGHRLEVESEEGAGTTMRVRLGTPPRTSRRSVPGMMAIPDVPPASTGASSAKSDRPLVLVVDEDEDARLLLGQHLEEAGCRVANADSGVDALKMARDLLPDMIFLDLRLPKISGFDVFRILKSDDALKDTPVVIASVAGSEARPGLAGAAAILDKPISRQLAVDLVRRWLPGTVA